MVAVEESFLLPLACLLHCLRLTGANAWPPVPRITSLAKGLRCSFLLVNFFFTSSVFGRVSDKVRTTPAPPPPPPTLSVLSPRFLALLFFFWFCFFSCFVFFFFFFFVDPVFLGSSRFF